MSETKRKCLALYQALRNNVSLGKTTDHASIVEGTDCTNASELTYGCQSYLPARPPACASDQAFVMSLVPVAWPLQPRIYEKLFLEWPWLDDSVLAGFALSHVGLDLAAETLSGARVIPAVLQLRIVLGMLIPGSKPVSKAKGRFTSLTAMLANFANLTTQTLLLSGKHSRRSLQLRLGGTIYCVGVWWRVVTVGNTRLGFYGLAPPAAVQSAQAVSAEPQARNLRHTGPAFEAFRQHAFRCRPAGVCAKWFTVIPAEQRLPARAKLSKSTTGLPKHITTAVAINPNNATGSISTDPNHHGQGGLAFTLDSKVMTIRGSRVLKDVAGNPICAMKEKLISLKKKWVICRGPHADESLIVASVNKELFTMHHGVQAKLPGSDDVEYSLRARGFIVGQREMDILHRGQAIGYVKRMMSGEAIFLDKQSYKVDLAPGYDHAFILCMVIIMDEYFRDGRR
ncbi:hypothetical protein WJX79_008346 [Trebouxia sp. C0005]